jgi:ATP synthase protein I
VTAAAPVPWDVSHVRAGLAATGVLAAIGIPLAWLVRDGRAAAWVAAGLALVVVFFSVSAYAVAIAGRVADSLTLPVALGTYLIKVIVLAVVLIAVRDRSWLDPGAFGLSVAAGTFLWTGVHARRVWTAKLYYVDPPAR